MRGGILKWMIVVVMTVAVVGVRGDDEGDENGLKRNFYEKTCPLAEEIVRNITWSRVAANPVLPAKLLRMSFHDCFVRGCDASVLIKSTPGNQAELEAPPNLSLAGMDVIDEIKAKLEEVCEGIVSCADIIPLAARDAVSFQYKLPVWGVLTGRRDGRISKMEEANASLPSPFMNFDELLKNFADQGLNKKDLVVLSGGHTIGMAHCFLFNNRLYNFTGAGDQDPSLDPDYADFLKTKCTPSPTDLSTVEMDPDSGFSYDSHYFKILLEDKGLFQSDAALLTDPDSARLAEKLIRPGKFFDKFAKAMKKLNAIKVKVGEDGEIRKNCGVVNPVISMVTDDI
ncbi:PREDICTED: peroxidase 27-like [Tarenaya hassleriana]|uniref:peroxidase 27-like n=1 Tax=Tarenaya hassleriana TaxID=28532 RepID=UPI00053C450E|nr:PREDICTED: peroxidase 27-like [Tarenaya hassleriana]